MNAPVIYMPRFIRDPDKAFERLLTDLDWEKRDDAPRKEYYVNDFGVPYTYGRGAGQRTYQARPMHSTIRRIRDHITEHVAGPFEVCFLNRYDGPRDALGWHADDSPEMDDQRPIVIFSLGASREIMFKPNDGSKDDVEVLTLEHGSICIMKAGMQDTHKHCIPKSGDQKTGTRISGTLRGFVTPR